LNASGEVEWQQTYGGIHNERIRNMAKTHDDGYIATTYLYSTDGTEVIVGRGSRETLVTKFSSSPTVACMGSTLNFTNTSSNATVYQWQVNGVSVGTTANLTYAFNTAGTYTLSLVASNASCSDTKDLVLTIKPNTLAASAGDDVSLTTGSSVTVGGSPAATGGSLPYSYAWLPSDNLNSATLANPIAHPLQTTNYILKVTDGAGCSHQDSVMVTVLAASKSYAVLTKKLDGGYYDLKGSILYFKYTGEYNTGNLTVKVYDEEHRLKSCPQLTTKQYGDNRFELDVSTCTGIIANTGYYIMEVQNEKTEKYLLKFKY
jgi:PKD repeat protein